jgi:hypothetical protein
LPSSKSSYYDNCKDAIDTIEKTPAVNRTRQKLDNFVARKSNIRNNFLAMDNPQQLYRKSLKKMAEFNKNNKLLIQKTLQSNKLTEQAENVAYQNCAS